MDTTKSHNILTTLLLFTMVSSDLIFYYIILTYERIAPQLLGQFVVPSITVSILVQVTPIVYCYYTANLHTDESNCIKVGGLSRSRLAEQMKAQPIVWAGPTFGKKKDNVV